MVKRFPRSWFPARTRNSTPIYPLSGRTLEAQLIDLADEVAYNTADLDDGFSGSACSLRKTWRPVSPMYAAIHEAMETQFPAATARERFYEGLRRLIDLLVSGLIEGTIARREGRWRRERRGGPPAVPHRLAAFAPQAAGTNRALKLKFLYRSVYVSPHAYGRSRARSVSMVAELFQFFCQPPRAVAPALRRAGAYRAGAPRGLRLHRGHDRRLLRADLRSHDRHARHSSSVVTAESSTRRTP